MGTKAKTNQIETLGPEQAKAHLGNLLAAELDRAADVLGRYKSDQGHLEQYLAASAHEIRRTPNLGETEGLVMGRVVDSTGKPARNVTISIATSKKDDIEQTVTTDERGEFTLVLKDADKSGKGLFEGKERSHPIKIRADGAAGEALFVGEEHEMRADARSLFLEVVLDESQVVAKKPTRPKKKKAKAPKKTATKKKTTTPKKPAAKKKAKLKPRSAPAKKAKKPK